MEDPRSLWTASCCASCQALHLIASLVAWQHASTLGSLPLARTATHSSSPPPHPPRPCRRIYGCVPLQGDPWVDVAEGEVGVAQCPKGLVITKLANISYGTTDGRVSADSEM